MDCPCGGLLEEGKSCFRKSGENFSLILDDLPAYRCTRCGKVFLSDDSSDKIESLLRRVERDVREIVRGEPSVHLYDYR